MSGGGTLRWRLASEEGSAGTCQPSLFGESEGAVPVRRVGHGEWRGLELLEVRAKRIVSPVPASSRMPFRWTINAYRGCSHACTYCFARPTHAWLGLGTGEDFERRLVVKVNAVERLRAELGSSRWKGDTIAMGTNTDPYQRVEGRYRLTRGIVGVLSEMRNPFSVLTKSTLVLGDLDLLAEAARRTEVRVNLSVGTLDEEIWRASEPGTPHPRMRLQAVRRLNEAGVRCGVLLAPILPGLSDLRDQLQEVVEGCVAAGAVSVTPIVLHLRPGVDEHYLSWLDSWRPDLAEECRRRYRGRAYLPRAEQAALQGLVGDLLRQARGRSGSSGGRPSPSGGPRGRGGGRR